MNGEAEAFMAESYYGERPEEPDRQPDGETPGLPARPRGPGRPVRTKQQAAIDRALATHSRRIGRTEAALAASTVVGQLQTTFPDVTAHPVLKASLPLTPLLLLQPGRRGVGDPRLLAAAAVAGLAITGEITRNKRHVEFVQIRPSTARLTEGDDFKLVAEARDGNGRPMSNQIVEWTSSDTDRATVDEHGVVTAGGVGTARISASVDGTTSDFTLVTVKAAD